jgi:uncharacterized protein
MDTLPESTAAKDQYGFTERNRRTIHAIFRSFSSVKEVILFGSRAVGTHRTYSDVDLAIVNEDFDTSQLSGIIAAFEESDLPYFTDVLFFAALRNEALKEQIKLNGKMIYVRN